MPPETSSELPLLLHQMQAKLLLNWTTELFPYNEVVFFLN